jgi:hypothetical protein
LKKVIISILFIIFLLGCKASITGNVVNQDNSDNNVVATQKIVTTTTTKPIICTDSDKGKNSDIKGTVKTSENQEMTDSCYNEGLKQNANICFGGGCVLHEYYCTINGLEVEAIHCQNGCQQGTCLKLTK